MLIYSVFTACCGLADSVVQLAIFRFLLGRELAASGPPGARWLPRPGPMNIAARPLASPEVPGRLGYRPGATITGLILPALRLACGLLCRSLARPGHRLDPAIRQGARDMAAESRVAPPAQHLSGQARTSHHHHRLHECCLPVCMVGALHLDSPFSVAARRPGRPRTQHCSNLRVDYRHADWNRTRLSFLRLFCRPLRPQTDLHRIFTRRRGHRSTLRTRAWPSPAADPLARLWDFRNRLLQRVHHHCQ